MLFTVNDDTETDCDFDDKNYSVKKAVRYYSSYAESSDATEDTSGSISEYLLLFAVTITAVFALACILLIISTIAKDVKAGCKFRSSYTKIATNPFQNR